MFGGKLAQLFSRTAQKAVPKAEQQAARAVTRGSQVSREGAIQALKQRAAQNTIKRSRIGDALVDASNVGLNSPLNITRASARAKGLDNKVLGRLYDKTGSANVRDLREVGSALTGGNNAIMDQATYAVTNRGRGVDLSDMQSTIDDLIGNMPKPVQNEIRGRDPLAMANTFRSAASDLRKNLNPTEGQTTLANMYGNAAKQIDDRIYKNVPKQGVDQLYDTTIAQMRSMAGQAPNAKQTRIYNRLADDLAAQPRSIANYRSFKKDFVDVEKAGKLTDEAGGGGTIPNALKQVPIVGDVAGAILETPLNAAAQAIGRGTRRLGTAFQSGNAQKVLGGAGLVGGGLLAGNALLGGGNNQTASAGGSSGLANTLSSASVPTEQQYNANIDTGGTGFGVDPAIYGYGPDMTAEPMLGGYTMSDFGNAMVAAMQAGDTKAATQYQKIYELLADQQAAQMESAQDGAKESDSKTKNIGTQVNAMMSMLGNINGGQTVNTVDQVLNTIPGLRGAQNAELQVYDDLAKALVTPIARAMGETGVISDADREAYKNMLPTPYDTKEVQSQKADWLYTLLGL